MTQHSNTVIDASNSSADLVPFNNINFGGQGEVIKPTDNDLYLQWFNGSPTTTFETAVGFHVQAGVNQQLDETLEAMGTKKYIVQHKSTNDKGEPNQVPYWALNWGGKSCSLFILSYGIKSPKEMKKDTMDRCGIAYGWELVKDKEGKIVTKKDSNEPKRQCRVQFRAYVHELVRKGFTEWFQLSFKGLITEDVLTALDEQFRVIDIYKSYALANGKNPAPFYGFSLPLQPGKVRMVGPKDGDQSAIYPPMSQVPQQISGNYLNEHVISNELLEYIDENDLLSQALTWSIQRSLDICGESNEAPVTAAATEGTTIITVDATAPTSGVPVPTVDAAPTMPQLPAAPDRPVDEEELKWITKTYCIGQQGFLKQICNHFQVGTPDQLRLSHYAMLQQEYAKQTR